MTFNWLSKQSNCRLITESTHVDGIRLFEFVSETIRNQKMVEKNVKENAANPNVPSITDGTELC